MHFLIYSVCLSPLCLYTVYKWKSQNTLTKKPTPSSFLSLMPLQASPFADVHFRLYTPDLFKPDWDMPSSLLLFFLLRAALMSLSCTSGPLPTERRTHWLKDVTIATREKKQKKKKRCTVRREKERIQRDGERLGGNQQLKDGEKECDRRGRQMERQRKSIGRWRKTASVSLRPQSHRPKYWPAPTLTTEDVSLRLRVFHTLSIHICEQC